MNVNKILGSVKNNTQYKTPLVSELNLLKECNAEDDVVKKLYGQIGLDIYNGKKVSLLESPAQKPSKLNFLTVIKAYLKPSSLKLDYDEGDPLWVVVSKFLVNRKKGATADQLKEKFGIRGLQEVETVKKFGFLG